MKKIFFVLCSLVLALSPAVAVEVGTIVPHPTDDRMEFVVTDDVSHYVSVQGGEKYRNSNSKGQTTYNGGTNGSLAGDLAIPATITYEGNTYTVTAVADSGFYAARITSLNIPYTVQTIGTAAFCNNKKDFSVTFKDTDNNPSKLETIGASAFYTSQLTDKDNQPVVLPRNLRTIGAEAFRGIITPFHIVFNDALERIEEKAFYTSTGLTGQLIFPESVRMLGSRAFGACDNVNYVEFMSKSPITIVRPNFRPNKVENGKTVPDLSRYIVPYFFVPEGDGTNRPGRDWRRAFRNGQNGPIPFLSKNVEAMDDQYVYDIFDINGNPTEDEARVINVVTQYCPEELTFPRTVTFLDGKERTIRYIGYQCFNSENAVPKDKCKTIKKIIIPSNIRAIGDKAFYGIAFEGTQFTIEFQTSKDETDNDMEGIELIGDRAFCRASCLTGDLVLPSTLKTLHPYAFYYCTGLTSITLESETPPTVSGAGYVFDGTFQPVNVPCGTRDTYKNAQNAQGNPAYWSSYMILDECDLSTFIDNNFLYHITEETEGKQYVTLVGPAGKMQEDTDGFVRIPSIASKKGKSNEDTKEYEVTEIAANAFTDNANIKKLYIPGSVQTINTSAFQKNEALEEVIIDGCKSIGTSAIRDCKKLKTLTLNEGIVEIKDRAFINSIALEQVTIPSTVEYIGMYAFENCSALTDIHMLPTTPPYLGGNQTKGRNIWVPCGYLQTYQTTNYGPGMWLELAPYMRSSCEPLVLGEGEAASSARETKARYIGYKRTFPMDEWVPLYLPFDVDSVWVEDEGEHYDIKPHTTGNPGHFFLDEITDITVDNDNKTGTVTVERVGELKSATPHLIRFSSTSGYYDDKYIGFSTTYGEYDIASQLESPTISMGGDVYKVVGNPGYVNMEASNAYEFTTTGNGDATKYYFVYKEKVIIPPFQYALIPTLEAAQNPTLLPRRFAMRSSDTGGGNVTTSIACAEEQSKLHYERNGQTLTLHLQGKACRIISAQGEVVCSIKEGTDEASITLPNGIYILHYEGDTQKILL